MSDIPKRWQDIPEAEREGLLELARLPCEQRRRMAKAGANILWWEGLASRLGKAKWIVITVSAVVGSIYALFDMIAAAIQGIGR